MSQVADSDYLLVYRISRRLAENRIARAIATVWEIAFPLNAMVLAKADPEHVFMLLSFLEENQADLARENIQRNWPDDLEEAEVPASRGEGFAPLAAALGRKITHPMMEMVMANQDTTRTILEMMAEPRPEADDTYVFSLPPEIKEQVLRAREERLRRKPS
jgi:hypothetical protein